MRFYQAAFEAAGFDDITYTEYDFDHGVAVQERKDLVEWWFNRSAN